MSPIKAKPNTSFENGLIDSWKNRDKVCVLYQSRSLVMSVKLWPQAITFYTNCAASSTTL